MVNMFYTSIIMVVVCVCFVVASNITLNDDPSLWPGHMQPLGAKQKKHNITTLTNYPSPEEFFSKYVKPGIPFLLKSGAKIQPAFKHWNNDYLLSFREAMTELVSVEPNHKEDRNVKGYSTSFKKFLDTYQTKEIYMVNPVPLFLTKDVLIPTPLQCNNTDELIANNVMWMSAGGTKSVLHFDDVDNINCVFRGSKDILLIDPAKYHYKVPIDQRKGAYSSVDVEKVNFAKYPALREVEYIEASMEEGDCLFIPYKWYHQINSFGNKQKQNIAVNIWFRHEPDHKPTDCDISDGEMTLDNYFYDDEEGSPEETVDTDEPTDDDNGLPLIGLLRHILNETENKKVNLEQFQDILHNVPGIFNDQSYEHLTMTEGFKKYGKEIFIKVDVNRDSFFDDNDINQILDDVNLSDEVEDWLHLQMETMSYIIAGQLADEAKLNPQNETGESEESEKKKDEL